MPSVDSSRREMLLVQAQEEGLKLLTVDQHLVDHPLAVTPDGSA